MEAFDHSHPHTRDEMKSPNITTTTEDRAGSLPLGSSSLMSSSAPLEMASSFLSENNNNNDISSYSIPSLLSSLSSPLSSFLSIELSRDSSQNLTNKSPVLQRSRTGPKKIKINVTSVSLLLFSLVLTTIFVTPVTSQQTRDDETPMGTSLAFVFDITGSMYDDLVQVIKGAKEILEVALKRREKPLYNYVLVPFHDPIIGPVVVTTDHIEFQEELKNIYVQGGGDCPEMSVGAIKTALEVSLPHSFIYVFTDARSKDYYLTEEVLSLIQLKQSQVVFVLTGDCGNVTHSGYRAYEEIAATSSGQVFLLPKSQVKKVLEFVKVAIQARKVNLLSINEDEGRTQVFNIPLDSHLKEVTVSVSGESPRIFLRDPEGVRKSLKNGLTELLNLNNILIYNLKDPVPGTWRLRVSSSSAHTLRVTGLSHADIASGFSKYPTKDMAQTQLRPIMGIPTNVLLNSTGLEFPNNLNDLELVDLRGNSLMKYPLDRDPSVPSLYNTTSFIPPEQYFYVKVTGVDDKGYVLQRTTPTAISPLKPRSPRVIMPEVTRGFYDQTSTITCQVFSLVPYTVQWYYNNKPQGLENLYRDPANVTLEIPRSTSYVEGEYACNATNKAGSQVAVTYLDVSDPPPVIVSAENVSALPGDTAILSCLAFSTVTHNMTWKRNNQYGALTLDPRFRAYTNDSLVIRNVDRNDEGQYRCIASNEGGSISATLYLKLEFPPVAQILPPKQTFIAGAARNFTCISGGYPAPTFTWVKDGVPVVTTGRIQVDGGYLSFKNLGPSDGGVYECTAANTAGQDSVTASLMYIEAPFIGDYEKKVLVAVGDEAKLTCKADGIPTPNITWYRSDRQLLSAYGVDISKDGVMVISGVQDSDAGPYRCVATNEAGKDTVDIQLEVGSPPEIVLAPDSIGIDIEGNGSLPCQAFGYPAPKISWRRADGKPLNIGNRFKQRPSGTLDINIIGPRDEGLYTCVAQNPFGVREASAFVSVTGIVRPLIAYTYPYVRVMEGETTELECVVLLGKPKPKLTWTRNGAKLTETPRRYFEDPGHLVIKDVKEEDEGAYVCKASNIGGNETYTINLDVMLPPRFLTDDDADRQTNFTVIQGRSVFLPCTVSSDPPATYSWFKDGSPISLTDIRYFVRSDGALEIFSADIEDAASYVCVASNIAGEVEKKLNLFVEVLPVIDGDSEETFEININESIVLPCEVSGTPKPTVSWTKNFVPLIMDSSRVQVVDGGLSISRARIDDKAIYECLASNIAGSANKIVTLIVYIPPALEEGSADVTVLYGETATLECEAKGDPAPTILWRKDGIILDTRDPDGGYYTSDRGSLTIEKVTIKDAGRYSCSATNPAGVVTKELQLIVHGAPEISGTYKELNEIIEKNPVILPCPAQGSPTPVVSWHKDGELLDINQLQFGMAQLSDGSLEISSTRAEDSGDYECIAENVAGIATRGFTLKVLVPPKLIGIEVGITPGERPKAIITKNITMTCPVSPDTDPPPTISWFRDNQKLTPSPRVIISRGGGTLTILGVDVGDEARYRCVAINAAGQVEHYFDLDVQIPPTIEESGQSPANQSVVKGRSLYISCPITGKPPPQVSWLKDGQPLSANLDPNVRLLAEGRRLEIASAKVTDRGRYVCIGENIAGKTTKDFSVFVYVPPSVEDPGVTEDREVVEGNSVFLRCPASGVPRPTITWFNKEIPVKVNTSRLLLLDNNWTLEIRGANVSDAGRYYCRAENVAGESEKTFDIKILVRAVINRKELDQEPEVIVNTTAVMNCPVTGNPPPEIIWYRNGVLLDASVHQRYEILGGGRQLRIYPTQVKDRGRYTCTASNRAGNDEINFDLNVLVPPRIDRQGIKHQSKVLLNSTVTISCVVTGTPHPIISWLKDSQPIVYQLGHIETRGDGSELVITGAKLTDTAQYTCLAENDAGEDSLNFKLEVQVRPRIPTEDIVTNPKVVENDTAVLVCPATGTPPPSIMWFMNGFPLELEVLRHITLDGDGTRLIISPVKAVDAGTYVCIAANEAGETEQKYELEVWVPPVIDHSSVNPQPRVIKGHTATIDCPVSGVPLPKITWLKAGIPVRFDARVQVLNGGRQLEIKETNEQDAALYTCEVSNEAGDNKADYNLVVLVPPSIDESNVVYNRKVNTGRDVMLECPVAGIPPPSIEWFIKGEPVASNDERLRDNNRILQVKNIQLANSGFYTCVASNEAGQLERNFNVAVLIPPSIDRDGLQTVLDVVQNKSVVIHCPATGEPEPDIVWTKNGYRLELPYKSYRLLDDSQTLEINNAQLTHAANYTCTASNDAGWDEVKFQLDVFVPPIIGNPTPDKLHVVMEQAISMRCTVSGTPEPSILWLKDGAVILEVDNESKVQILDKGQILQITNSQAEDQARYACHAENQAGFAEKYFDLEVWEPARINGSGRRVEIPVILDKQAILECPAEGSPTPEIIWMRKNSPIPSYGMPNIRIQNNGRQLVILSAQLLDFGEYSCKARNPAGEDRLQFRVSIVVPPEIEEGPEEVAAIINTRAMLLCESSSQPLPEVSWTKDNKPFPATGLRHRMLPSGSLEFMIVRLEDNGTYQCTASNAAGDETRTIKLYVQIPANIKNKGRETLKVAKGKSVTLVCDAEGSPPPTLLWLKYRQYVETNQRISVLENGSLHITDLRPSDGGIYTCLAQNNAGTASKDIRVWVQEPPIISVEQKVFTVLQNRTIVLPCRASGRPQPKIRWKKDGQDITSTHSNFRLSFGRVHYITLQTGGLAIPHTRAEDAGTYVCIAENRAGSTTNELSLVVQVPPMITAVKRQYVVSVGDTISLPCETRGSPTPRISWTKDRRRLDFRNAKFNILSNGTLVINRIEAGDTGNYICTAENTVGKDSQSRLLRVQVPPKFVTVPRDKELTVNSRFQLRCIARGIPTPTITWMLNGKPLAAPPSLNGVSILRVRNAMKEDAGEYTCVATNPANDQQVTTTARVIIKVPPRVIVPPGDRAVRIAEKVVLDCNVRGDPPPKILWTKDGRPVVLNDRIRQLSNGSLVIYDLGLSDAGNYKCIAINDAGTTEAQSIITVKTEPTFKIEPTNAVVEIGQTVMYDCVAEGIPKPEMSWWRGPEQLSSEGRLTIMVNNSLRIVAVQQEDVGLYRCLAANSLGKTLVEAVLEVVVHGQYSSWGEWGACSVTCGRGQHSRERVCDNPAPNNGGRDCQGPATEYSSCLVELCPVDGQWSTWLEWGPCSASCGTGQKSRRRLCNNPAPQMGGRSCHGEDEQTTLCKVTSCKVNGNWGSWSSWASCSRTCGEGTQERYRQCDSPQPQHGGRECLGETTETQTCILSRCAVDGNWSPWASWSACSLSCSGGVRFRRRSCDDPRPQSGGSYCPGSDMQQDYCNNEPCPVHGNWGTWSAWGKCSLSCGGGLRKRFRTCNNPTPSGTGRACAGSGEESERCNDQRCPVDGRFGEWSSWSECSVTCGQGRRERFRQCSQPVNGGRRCRGDSSQVIQCNFKPCYVLPREAQGNLIGYINSIDIPEATIIARMTPNDLTGTSTVEGIVRNVPPEAANHLQHLVSLLTPVYWTTAYEIDGALNGYSLTGGEFMREVQVEFPTGEILKMSQYVNGMDRHGNLLFDIVIRGEVPELGHLKNVHLAPYQEEYIQTGPGNIHAHSSRMFSADGITMPYAWSHTIDYNETIGTMPFLVQVLYAKDLAVEILPGQESLQYVVEASIGPGTPSNRCPPGFTHNLQYSFCQDENECTKLNPCSHICHNNPGSYSCSCPVGFSLKSDAKTCQDIDECSTGIANCLSNQDCLNREGSFRCVSKCQPGFERDESGDRCIDTNECEANPGICEQTCQNLVGSYRCSCLSGFRLEKDGRCTDVNECELNNNRCSHVCVNTRGSYRCECPPGFQMVNGKVCRDINECYEKKNVCPNNQDCVNTEGSFKCVQLCPPGFESAGEGQCKDIDECTTGKHQCRYNQGCVNLRGSYQCTCPRGFNTRGPGQPCVDIDECRLKPNLCSYRCRNVRGDYECQCPPGQLQLADRKSCAGLVFLEPGRVLPASDEGWQQRSQQPESFGIKELKNIYPLNSQLTATSSKPSRQRMRRDTLFLNRVRKSVLSHVKHTNVSSQDTSKITSKAENKILSTSLSTTNLKSTSQTHESFGFNSKIIENDSVTVSVHPSNNSTVMTFSSKRQNCQLLLQMDIILPYQRHLNNSVTNDGKAIWGRKDINECEQQRGRAGRSVCQHKCNNIKGGYKCSCPSGYRLGTDGYSCKDINECQEQNINCGPEKMCFNQRGGHTCIDIPCPPDYARDPTTKYCVLECVNPKIPCPPGAKYADIIEFRTISLPGGNPSRQDLIRLTAYNQNDQFLPQTIFSILENDAKLEFHLKTDSGKGIVYTLKPLQDSFTYQITVRAKSYDSYRRHIQYQTTFIIHISVSSYPY